MAGSAYTHHLNDGFFLVILPEIKIPVSFIDFGGSPLRL